VVLVIGDQVLPSWIQCAERRNRADPPRRTGAVAGSVCVGAAGTVVAVVHTGPRSVGAEDPPWRSRSRPYQSRSDNPRRESCCGRDGKL
jgi:hypothetical protein